MGRGSEGGWVAEADESGGGSVVCGLKHRSIGRTKTLNDYGMILKAKCILFLLIRIPLSGSHDSPSFFPSLLPRSDSLVLRCHPSLHLLLLIVSLSLSLSVSFTHTLSISQFPVSVLIHLCLL